MVVMEEVVMVVVVMEEVVMAVETAEEELVAVRAGLVAVKEEAEAKVVAATAVVEMAAAMVGALVVSVV